MVDQSLEPGNGAMVIACVDGECRVKTLRNSQGWVRLEATSPDYSSIRFSREMELLVFGVVTAVIHRFGAVLPPDSPSPPPIPSAPAP